jgi:hypothetical protein
MSIRIDPITYFPYEISLRILSELPLQVLGRCCLVSWAWNGAASDNTLWKRLFHNVDVPPEVHCKEYLRKHGVKSEEEILERIQLLVNQVTVNKKGIFTCLFPFDPGCKIRVELAWDSSRSKDKPVETTCIFIQKILSDKDPETLSSSKSPKDLIPILRQAPEIFSFSNHIFSPTSWYIIQLPKSPKNGMLAARMDAILTKRLKNMEKEHEDRSLSYFFVIAFLTLGIAVSLLKILSWKEDNAL